MWTNILGMDYGKREKADKSAICRSISNGVKKVMSTWM